MRIGTVRQNAPNRRWLLRIAAALLALLLTAFCLYHISVMFDSEISTMLVTEDTVEQTIFGEAVLFRNEIGVPSSRDGLAVLHVADGAHVAKNATLLSVYKGGGEYAALYQTLTTSIDALTEAKKAGDVTADLSSLKSAVSALSLSLTVCLENGQAKTALASLERLRILCCRVEALTDSDFTLKELIEALEEERRTVLSLAGETSETVAAPQSGYYYPDADDGYLLCSPEFLDTVTGSALASLADTLRTTEQTRSGAGTIVTDPEWRIAVPTALSAENLETFSVGGTYSVIFLDNEDERIKMTLERIVDGSEGSPAVLIFSTLKMPSGFSFDRLQNVAVVTGTQRGYSVPSSAVHTLDGETGVYVLLGNVVYFRRAEILCDLGTRCLVKTSDPSPEGEYAENTYAYVARNDALILSGNDLFHGKVLS